MDIYECTATIALSTLLENIIFTHTKKWMFWILQWEKNQMFYLPQAVPHQLAVKMRSAKNKKNHKELHSLLQFWKQEWKQQHEVRNQFKPGTVKNSEILSNPSHSLISLLSLFEPPLPAWESFWCIVNIEYPTGQKTPPQYVWGLAEQSRAGLISPQAVAGRPAVGGWWISVPGSIMVGQRSTRVKDNSLASLLNQMQIKLKAAEQQIPP